MLAVVMVDTCETAEAGGFALWVKADHYDLLALVERSFLAVVFVVVQFHH